MRLPIFPAINPPFGAIRGASLRTALFVAAALSTLFLFALSFGAAPLRSTASLNLVVGFTWFRCHDPNPATLMPFRLQ
jgi:hypothetical protein